MTPHNAVGLLLAVFPNFGEQFERKWVFEFSACLASGYKGRDGEP